ncbi:MAG: hypothetical protein AB7E31_05815 [Desulfitobacterium sp.]
MADMIFRRWGRLWGRFRGSPAVGPRSLGCLQELALPVHPVLTLKPSAPKGTPAPHKIPFVVCGLGEILIRISWPNRSCSVAGWKRPVSNLSPLKAFREERVVLA